ncbi:hypothetical protein VT84_07435 [Gemmata sp. SH-PL17]|uniref:hypothetical protein n=1 Tax=Gemmata sp. SH-PL17 TaxID=1630693 RepID=UPI00078D6D28|nr:hypothetical protein [Gemmata sp. SH-PL17]AMV24213.1 hypothetical protein VT84_07435 [Gemmata sp. SH-PL17]
MVEQLRKTVNATLDARFGGGLPWNQNTGTAFAIDLAARLAPEVANPVLYGRPRAGARALIAEWGLSFVPGEMFVDFVLGDLRSPTALRVLVGCESEMHENHGTGYSLDDENGYTKDFRQLLRFPAPTLLFAARVRTERLPGLEVSLAACAKDFYEEWSTKRVLLVLIPSASRRLDLVRLGIGEIEGAVRFVPFVAPAMSSG